MYPQNSPNMCPLELARETFTSLIRPHSLQRHVTLLFRQPLGVLDARVEEKVDEGGSNDGDEADEDEKALPGLEGAGGCFGQGVAKDCGHNLGVSAIHRMRTTFSLRQQRTCPTPFVEYQAHTRKGCSSRRYHSAVKTPKSGTQPASNRPRKKREAARVLKLDSQCTVQTTIIRVSDTHLVEEAMQACAVPQAKHRQGMRILAGTLTFTYQRSAMTVACERCRLTMT